MNVYIVRVQASAGSSFSRFKLQQVQASAGSSFSRFKLQQVQASAGSSFSVAGSSFIQGRRRVLLIQDGAVI